MKHQNKYIAAGMGAVLYAMICICIFSLNVIYNSLFWESFFFLTVSYVISMIVISSGIGKDIKFYFFHLGIYRLLGLYLAVSNAAAIFFIVTNHLNKNSVTAFLIQLCVLCVFCLCLGSAMIHKNQAQDVTKQVEQKNYFIRNMSEELRSIAAGCNDYNLKCRLEKLAEEVQYSVPKDSEEIKEVEYKIKIEIMILRHLVEQEQNGQIIASEKKIFRLIQERNMICRKI